MSTPSLGLRQLSVSELTETLEEVETAIRRYSEELIQALALRDELDYEKEVLWFESVKKLRTSPKKQNKKDWIVYRIHMIFKSWPVTQYCRYAQL